MVTRLLEITSSEGSQRAPFFFAGHVGEVDFDDISLVVLSVGAKRRSFKDQLVIFGFVSALVFGSLVLGVDGILGHVGVFAVEETRYQVEEIKAAL